MRRALNGNPTITSTHGMDTKLAYFGKHAGYDYGVNGAQVIAPEAGKIINIHRATPDGGNIIELQGKYTHRFLHLKSIGVTAGENVKEGDVIGVSGATGKVTGPHLHHDTRKNGTTWNAAWSNYVDWEALIKPKQTKPSAPAQGGNQVFNNEAEVQEAYLLLRGKKGSSAEAKSWVGQPKQRFFQVGKAEADSYRKHTAAVEKQLADVKKALANEKAKPPKTVVKEVEKIVEKPVEVIKVETKYVHDEETKNMIATIYNYFVGQWKTFSKYIKKD